MKSELILQMDEPAPSKDPPYGVLVQVLPGMEDDKIILSQLDIIGLCRRLPDPDSSPYSVVLHTGYSPLTCSDRLNKLRVTTQVLQVRTLLNKLSI